MESDSSLNSGLYTKLKLSVMQLGCGGVITDLDISTYVENRF